MELPQYVTISELVEMTGKDPRTLKKKLQAMSPVVVDHAVVYHLTKALALVYEQEPETSRALKAEKLKYYTSRNEKLRAEIEDVKSKHVRVEEIKPALDHEYGYVRGVLKRFPERVAAKVTGEKDPNKIKSTLDNEVAATLTELSTTKII